MVVGIVDSHIHASGIKALQDKARAIYSAARSSRPRLDILSTNVFISTLNESFYAILTCSFDRNARRGHIGKVSGAIAGQLNSPGAHLRILRRILPANLVALAIAPEHSTDAINSSGASRHSPAAV